MLANCLVNLNRIEILTTVFYVYTLQIQRENRWIKRKGEKEYTRISSVEWKLNKRVDLLHPLNWFWFYFRIAWNEMHEQNTSTELMNQRNLLIIFFCIIQSKKNHKLIDFQWKKSIFFSLCRSTLLPLTLPA